MNINKKVIVQFTFPNGEGTRDGMTAIVYKDGPGCRQEYCRFQNPENARDLWNLLTKGCEQGWTDAKSEEEWQNPWPSDLPQGFSKMKAADYEHLLNLNASELKTAQAALQGILGIARLALKEEES